MTFEARKKKYLLLTRFAEVNPSEAKPTGSSQQFQWEPSGENPAWKKDVDRNEMTDSMTAPERLHISAKHI